ncbi:MAG: hypothetical protein LBH55_04125 [Mycoplasmataceae bacterium]|jgi:cell division GTPase FtsZ|nr:hypothetical protein [Mycoplasmataceae bacterium]
MDINKYLNNVLSEAEEIKKDEEFVYNFKLPKFKIIGLGASGCAILNYLNTKNFPINIDMWSISTNYYTLSKITDKKINTFLLGKTVLNGKGTGGVADIGRIAAEADKNEIQNILGDTEILFLIIGLGKGTGSGSGPVIAKIAAEHKCIVLPIIFMPSYLSDGEKIYIEAKETLKEIKKYTNACFIMHNDLIIEHNKDLSFVDAFLNADMQVYSVIYNILNFFNLKKNASSFDIKNFLISNKQYITGKIEIPETYSFSELRNNFKKSLDENYSKYSIDPKTNLAISLIEFNNKTPIVVYNDVAKLIKELEGEINFNILKEENENQDGISYIVAVNDNETATVYNNSDVADDSNYFKTKADILDKKEIKEMEFVFDNDATDFFSLEESELDSSKIQGAITKIFKTKKIKEKEKNKN